MERKKGSEDRERETERRIKRERGRAGLKGFWRGLKMAVEGNRTPEYF
jgi:hypothetical protein